MKNDRVGDWLWEEWDGEGYDLSLDSDSSIIYCTLESVDTSNEVVKRALASCLQRDGVADSLGEGFSMIERAKVSYGYVGYLDGEKSLIVCDAKGETEYGDFVSSVKSITWVEV